MPILLGLASVEDDDERSDQEELSPGGSRSPKYTDEPASLLQTARTLVVSLFLPYTVAVDPSPPAVQPNAPLERRRSVGAIEFKRQRKASESRGLRPDPHWWHIDTSGLGNIGLQNALKSMQRRMADPLWIGSLGVSTKDWSDDTRTSVRCKLRNEFSSIPVFLADDEVEGHYNQFCKQVLWKPFHYQLPDYPKGEAYEEQAWKHYIAVNQKFANAIAETYRIGDIAVWINDYHLMLVPAMVRQLVPDAIIGFFLHIPFPSSEIFRCLHVRKQVLEGMLGADLIGFQTYPFMRHFLMTCTRLLALESTPRGVQLEDRVVSVMPIPIGINLDALNEKRNHPEVAEILASLREKYDGMKVLIGRDKNDYVKGVRQKMLAFERFLKDHSEWQGKVVLIQVVLSTTEANENECRVSDVVARINSRFGSIEYSPVVYLHQDISFSHYLALLTLADACVITSLRDGMNLTSHEYVVCQEEHHGPLVISEFAGTYGSFGAALRVNPWDVREVADAINDALTMGDEDKAFRWKELYSHVVGNTAQTYVETFTSELVKAHEEVAQTVSTSIPPLPTDHVVAEYAQTRKRIFFLDQDGTIMNFNKHSSSKLLSNRIPTEKVVDLVKALASDPRNIVYIMSGRCKAEMKDFARIPNVGLCAENGCFLKYANRHKWETMLPDHDLSWRKQVLEIFEYYTDRTPGSYIEQKEIGMVWHYGHADMNFGSWQAAECQNHIEQALTASYAIHALAKKRSIEVMPRNVNKGTVIRRVLEHHQGRGPYHRRIKRAESAISGQAVDLADRSLDKRRSFSGSSAPDTDAENTQEQGEGHVEDGYGGETDSQDVALALPTRERVDFIFCVGDDRADEYMFEYLRRLELHSHKKELARGGDLSGDTFGGLDDIRSIGSSTFPSPAYLSGPFFSDFGDHRVAQSPSELPVSNISFNDSLLSADLQCKRGMDAQTEEEQAFEDGLSGLSHSQSLSAHTSFTEAFPTMSDMSSLTFSLEMPSYRGVTAPQPLPLNSYTTRRRRCVITATVGKKSSAAKWFLTGPQEVLGLLERLLECGKAKGGRSTVPEGGRDLQSV
ncbi:hypothetical protein SpCBS45565_g08129 [Spizellomyces sp. 'palustris']|nr:hypothetical protein SpCBS45565_g08129 [Spizellomyces sp. 'palustris']